MVSLQSASLTLFQSVGLEQSQVSQYVSENGQVYRACHTWATQGSFFPLSASESLPKTPALLKYNYEEG